MFIEGALFKEIVNYALFLQLNEKLSVAQDENRRAFVIWDMGANKAVCDTHGHPLTYPDAEAARQARITMTPPLDTASLKRLRGMWTHFCVVNGLEPDTDDYNEALQKLFSEAALVRYPGGQTRAYNAFAYFMGEDLQDGCRKKRKRRAFFDMDGVMVTWRQAESDEELLSEGFFRDAPANVEVVKAVNAIAGDPDIEVFSLSAYFTESAYALKEKNDWLDRRTKIRMENRVFCPYGADKALFVPGGIRPDDVLLDDYTPNLIAWSQSGGKAVKLLNGINGTKGTWTGDALPMAMGAELLTEALRKIVHSK